MVGVQNKWNKKPETAVEEIDFWAGTGPQMTLFSYRKNKYNKQLLKERIFEPSTRLC
jgi:hypothetical protein